MIVEVVAQTFKVSALNLFRISNQIKGNDSLKTIFARIEESPIECKLVRANDFQVSTAHSGLDYESV